MIKLKKIKLLQECIIIVQLIFFFLPIYLFILYKKKLFILMYQFIISHCQISCQHLLIDLHSTYTLPRALWARLLEISGPTVCSMRYEIQGSTIPIAVNLLQYPIGWLYSDYHHRNKYYEHQFIAYFNLKIFLRSTPRFLPDEFQCMAQDH